MTYEVPTSSQLATARILAPAVDGRPIPAPDFCHLSPGRTTVGFLKKLQQQIGWVSGDTRKHGVVGRGTITDVEESAGGFGDTENVPTLTFTIEVTLEGEQPYVATYRQTVQRRFLDQLAQRKDVAVRVNPEDHSEIAIDMDAEFPQPA